MKFPNQRFALGASLLAAIFWVMPATGLESDRQHPLHIESDHAEFDETAGLTTYRGNVRLSQGSIGMMADVLYVKVEADRIVELIAIGSPAQYEQLPEPDTEKMVAQAEQIRYDLVDEVIELRGSASLSQQNATLLGGMIFYDVRNHRLQASADPDRADGSDRVRVTLPPLGGARD
jgi:lipopolysaccharide export system protein LptA